MDLLSAVVTLLSPVPDYARIVADSLVILLAAATALSFRQKVVRHDPEWQSQLLSNAPFPFDRG